MKTTVLFIVSIIFGLIAINPSSVAGNDDWVIKDLEKVGKGVDIWEDIERQRQRSADQKQRRAEREERQRQRSADQVQRRRHRDRKMDVYVDEKYHRMDMETRRIDLHEYLQLDENDRRNARLNSQLATEAQLRRIADLKAETRALRELSYVSDSAKAQDLREQIREKEREMDEIRSPHLFSAGESRQEFNRQYRGGGQSSGSTQSRSLPGENR